MMLRMGFSVLLAVFAMSSARAADSQLECDTEAKDLCMVAPEDTAAPDVTVQKATSDVMVLTPHELSGRAASIESDFALLTSPGLDFHISDEAGVTTTVAFEQALRARSRVRNVEFFLKNSSGSDGDLRVIISGRRR